LALIRQIVRMFAAAAVSIVERAAETAVGGVVLELTEHHQKGREQIGTMTMSVAESAIVVVMP